jgi:hypothetical protein
MKQIKNQILKSIFNNNNKRFLAWVNQKLIREDKIFQMKITYYKKI